MTERAQPATGLRIESCMQVLDVMTREVETIAPDASLQQAAEAMEAAGVGSLPVCQGRRLKKMYGRRGRPTVHDRRDRP